MRSLRLSFLVLVALLTVYAPAVGSEEPADQRYLERVRSWESRLEGLEYVADEIIVEFDDARLLCALDTDTLEGFEISELFRHRPVAVFRVTGRETLAEALARLDGAPGIRSVGPNLLRRCMFTPNDALYPRQEYHLPIHSPDAWDVTVGSASVNVAVVDTGLDIEHPEFAGRVVWTENFFDPDVQGADNVFDDSGHGTATTGIVAAKGNNEIGIAGMAWDVRILAFRACGGPDLQCTVADEVQAIDSAVARGAHVINLSLGGKGTTNQEIAAVQDAYNAGVVLVAAGGNGNPGELYEFTGDPAVDKTSMYYPAALPQVIGVAALDNKNGSITDPAGLTRAEFSNYGEDIVSVAAVGTHVETTTPYRPKSEVPHAIYIAPNYSRLSGTSFACPQVTGTACLLLSRFPLLSPGEVRGLIEGTAWPMGGPDVDHNGVDDYLGYGLLDAGAAVGSGIGADAVHENLDFLVGICPSPLFADDIFLVVYCKRGSDEPPHVSYFVKATAENGSLQMESLSAHANTYLGRFRTAASGEITIQVSGVLDAKPLESLSFVYTLID